MASADDVKKLASLARISIPDEEIASFAKEFDGILAYVGKLDELSLPKSDKRSTPAVRNMLRDDGEPHPSGAFTARVTKQFPDKEGDSLKVKQIITHE